MSQTRTVSPRALSSPSAPTAGARFSRAVAQGWQRYQRPVPRRGPGCAGSRESRLPGDSSYLPPAVRRAPESEKDMRSVYQLRACICRRLLGAALGYPGVTLWTDENPQKMGASRVRKKAQRAAPQTSASHRESPWTLTLTQELTNL